MTGCAMCQQNLENDVAWYSIALSFLIGYTGIIVFIICLCKTAKRSRFGVGIKMAQPPRGKATGPEGEE